jgi:hypothetical protein
MERRVQPQERRKESAMQLPAERRLKSRRRKRKLIGSPPPKRSTVDISDDNELRYWTKELGVNADEVRSAVQKVGSDIEAVRKHFGK